MNNTLPEQLKELEKEQNSLFNSTCQKCRLVYQFQSLYWESKNLERWECGYSCDCGMNRETIYYKIGKVNEEKEISKMTKKLTKRTKN